MKGTAASGDHGAHLICEPVDDEDFDLLRFLRRLACCRRHENDRVFTRVR
jgi:hypothetical protein